MRRPSRRLFLIAVPVTAALAAGAAVGVGAIPSPDGTIHACLNPTSTPPGQVRIIDAATQQCAAGEQSIVWNQQGPPGPAGPAGPTGPQGDPGPPGGGTSTSTTPDNTFSTPSQAGGPNADMFLELDGIPGESTDDKHKDEIDLTSFAFALGRGGDGTGTSGVIVTSSGGSSRSAAGAPSAKPRLQTLRVDKLYDRSSPRLMRAAATGRHIKSAVLTFRRSGDSDIEFLAYTLTDVQVTSYDQGGKDGDGRDLGSLEEEVGFTAARIHVTEQTVDSDGKKGPVVTADWTVPKQASSKR
jgi:type VI secretion system secreted protein Hcp